MINGNIYDSVKTALTALTPEDRAHADVFNNIFQQLISNDMTVESISKDYTDQQVQLVTSTGIPKLQSYRYIIMATEGQTTLQIPLSTYSKSTDSEIIIKNTVVISRDDEYTITEEGLITFTTPLAADTKINIMVLKHVPIGEDGAVHGKVIANGTIDLDKLSKPVARTFTTTVELYPSNWSDLTPYTQIVNVSEILSTDSPIIGLIHSEDIEVAKLEKEAWDLVSKAVTNDGKIIFTCFEDKPTIKINLQIKVVF